MVLLPMLRMLRVVLLLRKSFKSIPTERIAGSLISIVVGVVVVGAFLEWRVEYTAPGANITTLGIALWWAIVTTTTVGYGDTYPVTTAGRLIGSVIMVVGIGLIGTVSATVAAWFVRHKQRMRRAKRARRHQPKARPTRRSRRPIRCRSTPATTCPTTSQPHSPRRSRSWPRQQADLRAAIDPLATQRSG